MKKFLALMCSVAAFCLLAFSGCSDNDWTEVQSITYSVAGKSTTYTSKIVYEIKSELIDQSVYNSAPEEQKQFNWYDTYNPYSTFEIIPANKDEFISSSQINGPQEYFLKRPLTADSFYYTKYSIESYEFQYVKTYMINDSTLKIKYYEDSQELTIKVFTDSHEITYFSD